MKATNLSNTVTVTLPANEVDALLGLAARTTVTLAMLNPDPQKGAALDEQWASASATYRACKTLYAALESAQQQQEG